MTERCAWIFNGDVIADARAGKRVRYCPRRARPGSSYCAGHHRRCWRSFTPRDMATLEAPAEVA